MKQSIEILIVTRSVVLQQGLGALLEALPGVGSVKAVRELANAYLWLEAHQPGIVLLDSILLGPRPEMALEKIQTLSRETKRVLLVDDVQQVNLMLAYAEAILIKGISPSTLTTIMTNLLSEKGNLI
jgi:DNA-binding NarL/FixJ family response regulator